MIDREKVIKKAERIMCSTVDRDVIDSFCEDVIELLKEQEAVKPKCKERIGGFVAGLCPTCGTVLNNVHNVKACGKCGQAVKWE